MLLRKNTTRKNATYENFPPENYTTMNNSNYSIFKFLLI